MADEPKTPFNLHVEIDTASLKKVVEEGRLMEFATASSTLAAQHIWYQLVDKLAQAGAGIDQLDESTVVIHAGLTMEGDFGTGWPKIPFPDIPRPPWPGVPVN